MCRRILLSLFTMIAAAAAYFLRTWQLALSDPLNPYGIGLWALLGVTILLTTLLSIPEKEGAMLSQLHSLPVATALQGSGALLIGIGGGWQLFLLYSTFPSFAAISAAALLLGALGLFGGMHACSNRESKAGSLLLLPLAASALQLIAAYWDIAVDPHLFRYDMRILFLGAAAISMALLTDFVFARGKRRMTLVFLSFTAVLAGAALPALDSIPRYLSLVGVAFTALGYLIALLFGFENRTIPKYELVDDPFSTGRVHVSTPAKTADEPSPDEPLPIRAERKDDFDLSRVDRLLLEFELEDDGKQLK